MKVRDIGIVIVTILLLAQGCASSPRSEDQAAIASEEQHKNHSMGGMDHSGHSGMKMPGMSEIQAKLTIPSTVSSKTVVPLVIDIQDKNGNAIANFDRFQEKLMHLIVVSDNLQFFNHIHPTYKGNGRFEVAAQFPQPGSYTLFNDYKPSGQEEQVSLLKTQVSGKSPATSKIDLNRTKTFADTKVNLSVSPATVKAGEEVSLNFNLQDAAKNQPLTDLQPYLGEKGHLVIIKQSSPLTRADYIHAHAIKNTPVGQVNFITSFPQPGNYKLWGQFNRNGKIVTADFWVNVL